MMSKSTFPHWIYDNSPIDDPFGYGERAVEFMRRLRHPLSKAPKNAFQLYDFQERIIRKIYAPRHPDGRRIVEQVFLMLPRGARKTSLTSAMGLLHTIGAEREPLGQVIFAAADRPQAGIAFKEAVSILKMDKRLLAATKIYNAHNSAKAINFEKDDVTLTAISSDGDSQQGLTPRFALVDELHIWKGTKLWEAIDNGLDKTTGNLLVIATTAGRGQQNIGFEKYDYARKVATGEIIDPTVLPVIFEMEDGDDWQDEEVWHKVNPGLKHGFPDIHKYRSHALKAQYSPLELHSFQQFKLNVWQASSSAPLFDMNTYDLGLQPHFDLADLESLPCFVGVDLSVNGDLTAVVAAWRHDDGTVSIHPHFFVPADDLEARAARDGVPYIQWRDDGFITAIPGSVIEPTVVEDYIRELCARFNVQEVAFDPHLATLPMQHLYDEGITVFGFRQAPLTMGVAIGHLERVVNGKNIRHSGHPILRHHFDSVVAVRNSTGLVRMEKGTKTDRIDGAIATAMAIHRVILSEDQSSFLNSDDFSMNELWNGKL